MPRLTVIFRIISVYIFFPVFFFFSAILLSPVKFKMKHFNSYDGNKQAMFIHVYPQLQKEGHRESTPTWLLT